MITLENVSKRYDGKVALAPTSLDVPARQTLALIGPSGCGKSTLLMLLAGLLEPDAGTVHVGGRQVAGGGQWVPPEQRSVGVVFQDAALFPHLRVEDNVAFGLPRGRGRDERVHQLLELVDLAGYGRRYPHELSGGQQQRVALARALAPRPRAVLFDEAFGNLDAGLRASVRDQTVAVLREEGSAGVFVTHDQAEALAVGDRVAVMNSGRLEHVGVPEHAFHAPASRFVATFLGEADFLPGTQSGREVRTELGVLPAVVDDAAAAGPVEVMLRPHEVTFAVEPRADALVASREFRGASYLYTLRLPSGATVRSLQPHTAEHAVGTAVRVEVQAGHPVRSFPRPA